MSWTNSHIRRVLSMCWPYQPTGSASGPPAFRASILLHLNILSGFHIFISCILFFFQVWMKYFLFFFKVKSLGVLQMFKTDPYKMPSKFWLNQTNQSLSSLWSCTMIIGSERSYSLRLKPPHLPSFLLLRHTHAYSQTHTQEWYTWLHKC